MTGKAYYDLYQKAKELGLDPSEVRLEETKRHQQHSELRHLERRLLVKVIVRLPGHSEQMELIRAVGRKRLIRRQRKSDLLRMYHQLFQHVHLRR